MRLEKTASLSLKINGGGLLMKINPIALVNEPIKVIVRL